VSASAETPATTTATAPVDPVRSKLAEQTVAKLIPPGTYQKIMKDVMDKMAGGMVDQMMALDAATMAGMAGVEAGSEAAEAAKGKTMAEIMAEMDPNFKERMEITTKVMFSEMGDLMSAIEPTVREALAKIYARKYSAQELADMNSFFATPSGAAFAGNFWATFTDKEMIDASMGMMPKVIEAMPAIMKKVEAATAHLPPPPKPDSESAMEADADAIADGAGSEETGEDPYADETGDEPWYAKENWQAAARSKATKLSDAYVKANEKSNAAYSASEDAQVAAIDEARKRFLAEGWKPEPAPEPMAAATEIADELDAEETGDEPWYAEGAWTETEREKVKALEAKYDAAREKWEAADAVNTKSEAARELTSDAYELTSDAYDAYKAARQTAIGAARKRMLAEGWTPPPAPSETTEDSLDAAEAVAAL
jgi:hypothetical protein